MNGGPMFIGRERELKTLESRYAAGSFECVVVYGRRRVGKTTLINRFCHDKHAVYFQAIESDIDKNLAALSGSIAACSSGDPSAVAPLYPDFASALEAIFKLNEQQRCVFVIDEFPYLAKADESTSSVLQHAIDNHKNESDLMIVLCGSSMSFMEEQVLGYQSPIYGRRTAQLKIEPFAFSQARAFHPKLDLSDAVTVYGLTGGVPLYLEKVNGSLNVEQNLAQNFLDPSCYLFEEPGNLLKQELRDPKQYNNVLQTNASGASKLNEIATGAHISTSSCAFLLGNLQELGIVSKELPFGESRKNKGVYDISDSFFRFWYRYVPRYLSLIQSGRVSLAAGFVFSQLHEFTGHVFEQVCTQWLWEQDPSSLPVLMLKSGRWWGSDPATRRQEEIDIVASGEPAGELIAAECKWGNEPAGADVLDKLARRSQLVARGPVHLFVFSRAGFTDGCRELARQRGDTTLVSLDDMYPTRR